MTPDDVTVVLAVLATAGAVGIALVAVGCALPATRRPLLDALAGQGVPLAWLAATVATLGSLYLSEVAHFPPCRLCWFQRVALYPAVVVLGLGWLRRDAAVRVYGMVLAGLGLAVNLWHVAIEIRPSLEGDGCDPANPCSIRWVEQFGFWTIPRMATVAFVLIIGALALDGRRRPPTPDEADPASLPSLETTS